MEIKNLYKMKYENLKLMSREELFELIQEYNISGEYDDIIEGIIGVDELLLSIIEHIKTFNRIVDFVKMKFVEEIEIIELRKGRIEFITIDESNFSVSRDALNNDLYIDVSFKSPRYDNHKNEFISGKCTCIATDDGGNQIEYKIDYDEIYKFISDVINDL